MHSPTYKRAFYLILAVLLGLAVYHIMGPFWDALAWAVVLGLLLHPIHKNLTHRFGGKSGLNPSPTAQSRAICPWAWAGPS